jgi:hypothetical protein
LDDDVDNLSYVFETVNLAACEAKAKFLFYRNKKANMSQAIPALHIVRRHAVAELEIIDVKDVTHGFNETCNCFFARHRGILSWLEKLQRAKRAKVHGGKFIAAI